MTGPHRRTTAALTVAILIVAGVIRLSAAAYWHQAATREGKLFRLGDSHSYWVLAETIANGRPYQYGSEHASIFRAPLYPLCLAWWTRTADPQAAVWSARCMGCALGTLSVGLAMWLARQLGGTRPMLLTGLLAAIYPGAVGMSIVILSEAVFCPLMLGHLACWQFGWRSNHPKAWWRAGILAGACAGLAILARPSWLLFTPMLGGCGLLFGPHRKQHATILIATVIGISATMLPWWVRNAFITGRFVPTTLQVGPSLYDGLHAGATGASDEGMDFMQEFVRQQQQADTQSPKPESTFEYRLNQRAQRAAMEWLVSHPGEALVLAIKKFSRTWSLWPNGGEVGSSILRGSLTVGCAGLLALAIVGSFRMRKRNRGHSISDASRTTWMWSVYWMPCVYFTLLHMIFVASIRYREPALLVLTIIAGQAALRTDLGAPNRDAMRGNRGDSTERPD